MSEETWEVEKRGRVAKIRIVFGPGSARAARAVVYHSFCRVLFYIFIFLFLFFLVTVY